MAVLNTHVYGDLKGAPILALHGIQAHGRRFGRIATTRWASFRTHAVDLRGHGHSTWEAPWSVPTHVADLLDTLDAHDLAAVDVVGHSYGGAIGLALLAAAPARVRRLVLLDPALLRPGASGLTMADQAMAFGGWSSLEEAMTERMGGLPDEVRPMVADDLEHHLEQGPDGRFRFRFAKPAAVTGWGELCRPLPTVAEPRPTLLVAADRAGFVTPEVEAGLRALLGADLTVEHLDCGHIVYWERFDDTAAVVSRFLA